jgi:drug/metabolite transporter (DMT)-like permease
MRSSRYLPLIVLALLPMIWGYSWIPSKLGIIESSAFLFALLRTLPISLVMLALLPLTGRPLLPRAVGLTAAIGTLQVAGFAALTSAALVTGGAGHTAMLANTWQFWLLFIAWPLLGERIRGVQWLAVCIGLGGLLLIIEPWRLRGVLSSLLTLAAAVCYAFGTVLVKVAQRRQQLDILSLTVWQNLFGSIPLVVLAAVFPGQGIDWSGTFVWSLLFCAVMVTGVGSLLWLYLLKRLPANLAGLSTIGTPVVGVLASWLQLGEHLSVAEIVGMALVVAALGLLGLWGLRNARTTATRGTEPATVAAADEHQHRADVYRPL